jgi:acetylornithine deacetylase
MSGTNTTDFEVHPAIDRVWREIENREEELIQLVSNLVWYQSTLGNEADVQHFVAGHLQLSGLETDVWDIDESLKELPEAGDSGIPFEGRPNVAGVQRGAGGGRSLILNGHVDVVSPEPVENWTRDPWITEIDENRMYGRGALDMKSGVAINLMLPRWLRDVGIQTHGDIIVQSVIEEECTGNGALDMSRRYSADAAVITEPTGGTFTQAHVGVMWFKIRVKGRSAHAAVAPTGVNAISKTVPIIRALEDLDRELNEGAHPAFEGIDHPINLNIGVMSSGDWPSTVPGMAELDCRVSFYPGKSVQEMRSEVEQAVQHAAQTDEWLRENPPEIVYHGFQSGGSTVSMEEPHVQLLGGWHQYLNAEPMRPRSGTGTNDMRYFNFAGIPCGCYGPGGRGAHAADEYLDLTTLVPTAKVLAAFLLDWCGIVEE